MSWNYRIFYNKNVDDYNYGIHETYYDKDGRVEGLTERPVSHIDADTLEELRESYDHIGLAFNKPILDYDTMKPIELKKSYSYTYVLLSGFIITIIFYFLKGMVNRNEV